MSEDARAEMKKRLAEYAELVNKFLYIYPQFFPLAPVRIKNAMCYSLLSGGKRLRSALCLHIAELAGELVENVLPFAAAIEMIHTYSLIHDDLPAMDNDDLRRGAPSCHKKFDEATAILAGDGLLTDAFAVAAASHVKPQCLVYALAELALAAGSGGMAGGQVLDMEYTGKKNVTLGDIEEMQSLKTGAMIRLACISGVILANGSQDMFNRMSEYGAALGGAFQIADDILDITGNAADIGKPVGSDAASGKNTIPALVGIVESRKMAEKLAEKAIYALYGLENTSFLRAIAEYAVTRSA